MSRLVAKLLIIIVLAAPDAINGINVGVGISDITGPAAEIGMVIDCVNLT